MRATHTTFGVAATLFIFRDASGFFDIDAQVFRFGFNQPGDHALFDNRIAARAKAGTKENVGDITPAALGAIQVIMVLCVARHFALDGNLGKSGVFALQTAVAVIEHQLDRCLPYWFAAAGPVKNNIGHAFAAQVLGGRLTHYPTHSVDDIGFAAPVRAHNRTQVARKVDRRGINKRFKPCQLDTL